MKAPLLSPSEVLQTAQNQTPRISRASARRSLINLSTALALTTGLVPQIALAENGAPTSTSANASADKGVGRQMASNGQPLAELANLSTEEMGKLPLKIQNELEEWMIQQEQRSTQEAIKRRSEERSIDETVVSKTAQKQSIDETVVSIESANTRKREVVVSLDRDINAGKEAIITKTRDWWIKTEPSLVALPQEKVISIFKQDIKANREILQTVITNKFPNYQYAEQLLKQL